MKLIMCNAGTTDKIIRVSIGLVLLVTLFAIKTWFWLLASIPIVTGLADFCLLYAIFGISAIKTSKKWWQ